MITCKKGGPTTVCWPPLRYLSQEKDGEEKEGSSIVRITYLSLGGEFLFYNRICL